MTSRKAVDQMIRSLAAALNRPASAWRKVDGRNVANVGALYLDSICPDGRTRLYEVDVIATESGGCSNFLSSRRATLGELYQMLESATNSVRAALGEKTYWRRLDAARKAAK